MLALVRRRRSGYTATMVVGGPVLVAGLTQTHHWQAAALVAVGALMLLSAVLGYGSLGPRTASGPVPPPAG